jgi:hypothetical protein
MNFSATDDGNHLLSPIRTLHQHTQSVGATGGVYKGQGRNQRRLFQVTGQQYCSRRMLAQPATMSHPQSSQPVRLLLEGYLAVGADYILSTLCFKVRPPSFSL